MTASDDANKAAKDTVRLRANPPRVARLSRPVVIALGGVGAAAIGAALVLALQPRTEKAASPAAEQPNARPTPTAVANAPKTYGDVPRLGPPLPGDLGRPIVSAKERGVAVDSPAIGRPAQPEPAVAQAKQARQQAFAAARASNLFSASARSPAGPPTPGPAATIDPLLLAAAPASSVPQGSQAGKRAFLDRPATTGTQSAFRPTAPATGLVLQAQTVITAALVTAVNSDLPGPVSAQVTRNVYDSLTGRVVLIPQGSRMIGVYDADVSFGQRRVLLAWDRIIFPDGRSLQLDRLAGADAAGRSGLADKVDAHWGSMAKAALLSSVLGVGAELGSDDDGDVARALRRGVHDTVSQTGQQVVRQQLNVQPTLTLRAGLPVTILVTRDIAFGDDAVRP